MSNQYIASAERLSTAVAFAHKSWPKAGAKDQKDWDGLPIGPVLQFARGRQIYAEGSDAEVFYKVVTGIVRTCKFFSDGRRQIDAFYVAKEVFGLEAGAEHRLSAEAATDCTLISYRHQALERMVAENETFSRQIISYVMRSLARSQDHSILLGRKTAVEKVAAFLMELTQHSTDVQAVAITMTRRDIADYLGLSPETVSRTITMFEQASLIERQTAHKLRFKDATALRELNF